MKQRTPWTVGPEELDEALALLGTSGLRADVIIPARNEASTIGAVIDAVFVSTAILGELVVVDDHSTDDTATVAERHGARVLQLDDTTGKGEAVAAGIRATAAPYVVFLDADVVSAATQYLPRLVAPFVLSSDIVVVKGFYVRPLHDMPSGGGRVNDLMARPLLSVLYPTLSDIRQPLAGETAVRRDFVATTQLGTGYTMELALLLDVAERHGSDAVAQVDLGLRRHRNRPLDELRPMATDILRATLHRFGVSPPAD